MAGCPVLSRRPITKAKSPRDGELGHVEPLLDGLADRKPCPRVCLLVDLALEPGERNLGLRITVRSLLEVALLAGQWVDTDVDDRPVAARAQLLDVAASASPTGWHAARVPPFIPRTLPRRGAARGLASVFLFKHGAPGSVFHQDIGNASLKT
jgi:hypothetical protein